MAIPIAGSFRINDDHPCLAGHFPGQPLVPGVVLLAEILAVILPLLPPGARAAGFDAVKFVAPVLPGQAVVVSGAVGEGIARFAATVAGTRVVSGTARVTAR